MFVLLRRFDNSTCTKVLILCGTLTLTAGLQLSDVFAQRTRNPEPRPGQSRVQPLDPLTPDETELAAQIASSDTRVKEALGKGRQLLVQVLFLALKSPDYRETNEPAQMKIGRHAAVLFYIYESDRGLHVVVDLEQRAVSQITRLEGIAVPLAYQELTEAFDLALRNQKVRGLLGARVSEFQVAPLSFKERPRSLVEGLRVVAASPSDPCFKHRCIDLLFRLPQGYLTGNTVTVDLTAQTVRVERTVR